MAFEWTEKENKRNIIYAEDINAMAREVVRLEKDKADSSTTLFGYGIEDAYTQLEADEKFAKKSTSLSGYGISDAYTKTEIDRKIKTDNTPTENSTNLITSGGVYKALQGVSVGEAQSPLVFDCIIEESSLGNWTVSTFEPYENVVSAFKKGQIIIAQTQIASMSESGIVSLSNSNLICIGKNDGSIYQDSYIFQGISDDNKLVVVEIYKVDNEGNYGIQARIVQLSTQDDLNTAIGDVETSLENIIAKYGLGGEE